MLIFYPITISRSYDFLPIFKLSFVFTALVFERSSCMEQSCQPEKPHRFLARQKPPVWTQLSGKLLSPTGSICPWDSGLRKERKWLKIDPFLRGFSSFLKRACWEAASARSCRQMIRFFRYSINSSVTKTCKVFDLHSIPMQ